MRRNRSRTFLRALVFSVALLAIGTATVQAASPGWKIAGVTAPTHLPPAPEAGISAGQVVVHVANVGGLSSSGAVTVEIGPLPVGIATAATPTGLGWSCVPPGAGQTTVTCSTTEAVPVETMANPLLMSITISPSAAPSSSIPLSVEGGGGSLDETEIPVTVSAAPAGPGVQTLWAGAFDANGQPYTQAGGHPARAGAFFRVNTVRSPSGAAVPVAIIKDIGVELPPGFIGNPLVTPRCPQEKRMGSFLTGSPPLCPLAAVIGRAQPILFDLANGGSPFTNREIYNDIPAKGSAAQFTFEFVNAEATILGSLRSDRDYGVTVEAPKVPIGPAKFYGAFTMLNGNPEGAAGKAFLTNPMSCAEQASTTPITKLTVNSWEAPEVFGERETDIPPIVNCAALEFKPDFSFQPAADSAATGTSAEARLTVDQAGLLDPNELAPPHLKKSVVTLPEGMVLNPAAADGLKACTTAQMGLMGTNFPEPNPIRFNMNPVGCPDAAKIGTAEVVTPLLEDPIDATLYLAAQGDNPFKSLLAMYIVVEDERTGIVLKLPGKVTPNPVTGQLTAEFDNNPQTPFEELNLKFRGGGPRSTMATPDTCGEFTTKGTFTPWSAPESGPAAQTVDSFYIGKGVGGTLSCPATKASRPFEPALEAGATSPVAGKHSPFTLRLTRPDGDQELSTISVSTPPGFAATLKGVAVCSDAQIAQALARSNPGDGAAELASPSCPASSQVGTTTIGAGVGSQPFYVKTGKVYRTGPYRGAPISLTFIVPAVAGPFDLGVQVVRTALRVNPVTAQITAESDPIPQILQGIPLQIRDVRVDIDRPGFALNPTNCEEMGVTAQVTGGSGAAKSLSNRFQVDGCKDLGFKPKLQLTYKGATKRTGNPGLRAVLTQPEGQANISRTVVLLPLGSFIDNAHINNPCTRAQYAENACPASSILGSATAWSPLLDQPLSGNVYFRSNGGERELPDVVASLRGEVDVELVGFVDAVENKKAGTSRVRNTFAIVPDAAVSRFELNLKGGKVGLIENSKNLCKQKNVATVKMSAHNGRKLSFSPVVRTSCPKKKKAKAKK